MEITINVKAPELAKAIIALAEALSGNKPTNLPVIDAEASKAESKKKVVKKEVEEETEIVVDPLPETLETKQTSLKLEEVRVICAKKAKALGKEGPQKIKAIIKKYGAEQLTGVDPDNYEALIKDVEAL